MIQPMSIVKIADNTGAKMGRVFKVLGSSKKRYARIGDVVMLSVIVAEPRKMVKKKDMLYAVVVRTKQPFRRKDGSYIKFDENAVVIIEKGKLEPRANRVFVPSLAKLQTLDTNALHHLRPKYYNHMKIKKGDNVIVIAGKDKGKTGKVARAFPRTSQVVIDGVNMQKRHHKARKNEKQGGGIIELAAPVHVSNVQLVDPKTNKPTRVGIMKDEKTNKNTRVAKKSGTTMK